MNKFNSIYTYEHIKGVSWVFLVKDGAKAT